MASRPVLYYGFGDERVARLPEVAEQLRKAGINSCQLYRLICDLDADQEVFDGVLKRLLENS